MTPSGRKWFNHVYKPSLSSQDDVIEITPLVEWHKRNMDNDQFEPVDNSYSHFRSVGPTLKGDVPDGWVTDDDGNVYIWNKHDNFGRKFRYPVRVVQRAGELCLHRYDNRLYFKAQRAWLRLGRRTDCSGKQSFLCANLEDDMGTFAGTVRFNSEDSFSDPDLFCKSYEFVAISTGSVRIVTDDQITGVSAPNSIHRRQFGGRVLDEWVDVLQLPVNSETYNFYNVLLIERDVGTAYRKALGRVLTTVWERQNVEEIDLVLG
ncbi:hypothetical protein FB567DRAFT_20858 [Paraphoma chrysanthemicola]|uniref:Uncharacterized protein n=1 Tax=Paraphoma chrysanthemicola TaxID=798071 RepID=A0A8K0RHK9_9PLEO|nr:hypothetical protein FB567DRAFT_20858 [Paraphoma chrysanthemicola]